MATQQRHHPHLGIFDPPFMLIVFVSASIEECVLFT